MFSLIFFSPFIFLYSHWALKDCRTQNGSLWPNGPICVFINQYKLIWLCFPVFCSWTVLHLNMCPDWQRGCRSVSWFSPSCRGNALSGGGSATGPERWMGDGGRRRTDDSGQSWRRLGPSSWCQGYRHSKCCFRFKKTFWCEIDLGNNGNLKGKICFCSKPKMNRFEPEVLLDLLGFSFSFFFLWGVLPSVTAGLCCLCLTQLLTSVKPQQNGPQGWMSNLYTTLMFN